MARTCPPLELERCADFGLSRINRQKSEISAGVARQEAETAIYRKVTGKRPDKKRRRTVPAWWAKGERDNGPASLNRSKPVAPVGEKEVALKKLRSQVSVAPGAAKRLCALRFFWLRPRGSQLLLQRSYSSRLRLPARADSLVLDEVGATLDLVTRASTA
jgi:hypothetical protein